MCRSPPFPVRLIKYPWEISSQGSFPSPPTYPPQTLLCHSPSHTTHLPPLQTLLCHSPSLTTHRHTPPTLLHHPPSHTLHLHTPLTFTHRPPSRTTHLPSPSTFPHPSPLHITHLHTPPTFTHPHTHFPSPLAFTHHTPPHSRSGELRTQKLKVPSGENTDLKRSPFKALSRSVYSHKCYAYCQRFHPRLFLHSRSIYLHFFPKPLPVSPVLAVANTRYLCRPAE